MSIRPKYVYQLLCVFGMTSVMAGTHVMIDPEKASAAPGKYYLMPPDTSGDTNEIDLPYPFDDDQKGGLFMDNPSNVKSGYEYNPETGNYEYTEKIGDFNYRNPSYKTFDEYLNYSMEEQKRDYWRQKSETESINQNKGFRPQLEVESEVFDRIFGGNTIDIRPQGSAELSFGVNVSRIDNPILSERQRRTTTFDFDQKIQLNVIGNIGDKLQIRTNYNTEATFDFENQMKLEYTGYEDEIIQKVEAGNVSLPLKGSLITGSQTLFGIKTELQFGRLTVTSIFSEEKGEKKQIEIEGGAQVQEFEKSAADYEANKHYFLSHFFRDQYESALSTPPIINSRVNITKIEVWVTNFRAQTDNTRDILAFMDLGESNPNIYNAALVNDQSGNIPRNETNDLYDNITGGYASSADIRNFGNAKSALENIGYDNGVDFEKLENAKLLSSSEYTVNERLGYISLNQSLNSTEVLAVAFQYTYNGKTYQVGEFSTDGIDSDKALYLKLLKTTNINTNIPTWELMMKNIYSIGAYNVNKQDFLLDVWFLNPETGVEIPFIPAGNVNGLPLINVLNVDRVDNNDQSNPDGVFDYIPDFTINPSNGRIIFPVLEPFGSHLRSQFDDPELADRYAFDSLYTTLQTLAEQDADKNRYLIKGEYQSSSSSEISLGAFNIPEGSVVVTAGGAKLIENQDYTVDYNLGRVKIINEGILKSGTPIKVSLENNTLFSVQKKRLMGTRFDYRVSDDINLGGTVLNLTERPLTRKINIGDEPISNTIVGVDGTYTSEAPMVTRMADMLPFYDTKEKSTVTVTGEFAYLIPGNSRAITKEGISYIDDFEGSQSTIDLRSFNRWRIASTPQGQTNMFPEGELNNDLDYGKNRAKLAWYVIDPIFFRNDSRTPEHIKNDEEMQSNHYMREVLEQEVFPNRDATQNVVNNISVLDLAFYPKEKGPYNYDVEPTPGISAGIDPSTGQLSSPASRWGGIMRNIETNDFESSNVEFIQFWMMDPFDDEDGNPNHSGGYLYFNLGDISEDILKDSRKAFENGLPTNETEANDLSGDTVSVWGKLPDGQSIVNTFDNDPESREYQDVGLDGIPSDLEEQFFDDYVTAINNSSLPQNVKDSLIDDVSSDDFHYYRGDDYDDQELNVLERYKKYNGLEGNSPASEQTNTSYSPSNSTLPDVEDINQNNNLDETERYYQYRVKLDPQTLSESNVGNNYITDVRTGTANTPAGTRRVKWYQFKIPVRKPDKTVNGIRDFKSIRFMRMFLRGFDEKVVLRFARLELVRGEWRRYEQSLLAPGDYIQPDEDETSFVTSAVNIEENGERVPIPYVIPPGIQRERTLGGGGASNLRRLNEQSLVLDVCNLKDGDTRAAYKNIDLDIRQYKRLKMFIHAESKDEDINPIEDGSLSAIIRMGTDFDNNYYEYEIPLDKTDWGASSPEAVWPEKNNVDLIFEALTKAKEERNQQMLNPASGVSIIRPYETEYVNEETGKKGYIRVKGNPNLAEVKVLMIGVKNPKSGPNRPDDDGMSECAEVWVNELRLSDFNNKGGWATTGRVTTKVADLGTVTLAGSKSTPGFGSIEEKLNERQQENRHEYTLLTDVELGKLLPGKTGISIPLHYDVSEGWVRPRYNPLDPDLELKETLRNDQLPESYRDSIKRRSETYTKRRSVNFTNVRKRRLGESQPHFWDVENFSLNYAYTEEFQRDINTEYNTRKTHRGGLIYTYNAKPKNYKPFENIGFIKKNKAFQLIKDFNFYLFPKQYSFQTSFSRMYNERQRRNNTGYDFQIQPYYQKNFFWDRNYSLKHDFAKSLKFDFNASNKAIIGEPSGRVDNRYEEEYQQFKDSVKESISEFGVNTNYRHDFNLNYKVPIDKFPLLSWVNINAQYSGSYNWQRAPIGADSLGNTIQNSNTKSVNGTFNMLNFYNKIDYLKELNQPKRGGRGGRSMKARFNKPKTPEPENDTTDTTKPEIFKKILDNTLRLAMSLKNVSFTYSETEGTMLPGYSREMQMLGFDPDFDAPGYEFVSGFQDKDFAREAAENGWLTENASLINSYTTTYSQNYNARATIKPVEGLRIELTGTRNYAESYNQQFFWNDSLQPPDYDFSTPPTTSGNFSISYITWNTAFESIDAENDYESDVYKNFLENRDEVSQRRGEEHGTNLAVDDSGYVEGYGATSQQVLIPAFLAGYSGTSGDAVSLENFPKIPLPNWRITFDGLNRIKLVKKYLKNITINHAYRSTYNVSSFTSNLLYEENAQGTPTAKDQNGNFIAENQITTVSISEQFSPLINFDMTWHNSLLTRVEFKKDRNVSLSMSNNQVTEIKGKEVVIGAGYRFKQVKLPFKVGQNKRVIQSDLDLRADVSVRNNKTVIRKITENFNQLTAGQQVISIKVTADYMISKQLNIRAFYDRIVTNPFVSNTFPTANTNAGISLRFALSQ